MICAGGGGAPVLQDGDGHFRGAEAVVDKDLSTALLARDLGADALVILTDVANVETGFGTDAARPIGRTTPAGLRALKFPAGSMGPKVEAACRFVEATGKPAMIGRLDDAADLVRGTRGHRRGTGNPAAQGAEETAVNAGDTAWVMVSAALVLFMTVGLAFFYGGLEPRRNVLNMAEAGCLHRLPHLGPRAVLTGCVQRTQPRCGA